MPRTIFENIELCERKIAEYDDLIARNLDYCNERGVVRNQRVSDLKRFVEGKLKEYRRLADGREGTELQAWSEGVRDGQLEYSVSNPWYGSKHFEAYCEGFAVGSKAWGKGEKVA